MTLYIGTNYHPYDWPREQWEKDFARMKEAGFTTVCLGHLCWDSYEPQEGACLNGLIKDGFMPKNRIGRFFRYFSKASA